MLQCSCFHNSLRVWSPVELTSSYQEQLQASLNGQVQAYRNFVCSPRTEREQQEGKYYPYRGKKKGRELHFKECINPLREDIRL